MTRRAVMAGVAIFALVAVLGSPTFGVASPAADKSIAQAGLLTLQDFPAGWAPQPAGTSNTKLGAKLVSSIAACKPLRPLLGNGKTAVRANSPSDFTDGSVTLSNAVNVYPSVTRALLPFNAFRERSGRICLQALLKQGLEQDLAAQGKASEVQGLHVAVQPASPPVTLGDGQTALEATITGTTRGIPITIYFEYVIVRVGRALTTFTYEDQSEPISDVMPAVILRSVTRLQSALGLPAGAVTAST